MPIEFAIQNALGILPSSARAEHALGHDARGAPGPAELTQRHRSTGAAQGRFSPAYRQGTLRRRSRAAGNGPRRIRALTPRSCTHSLDGQNGSPGGAGRTGCPRRRRLRCRRAQAHSAQCGPRGAARSGCAPSRHGSDHTPALAVTDRKSAFRRQRRSDGRGQIDRRGQRYGRTGPHRLRASAGGQPRGRGDQAGRAGAVG